MIDVNLKSGLYVVAVSGGVDSMVLLDLLRRRPKLKLVVAHVDHGLRDDSELDTRLVAQYCASHNIRLVYKRLNLASKSELSARQARYNFLQQCRKEFKAIAILTAHHRDDLIETAILNIMRGTGWRGLAPFTLATDVVRPLLSYTKTELIAYARKNLVPWREDLTNTDEDYLRNRIRHSLIPMLDQKDPSWEVCFLQLIAHQQKVRGKIEQELRDTIAIATKQLGQRSLEFQRYIIIMSPNIIASELLQAAIKQITGHSLQNHIIDASIIFAKVAEPGKTMVLNKLWRLRVTKRQLIVEPRVT